MRHQRHVSANESSLHGVVESTSDDEMHLQHGLGCQRPAAVGGVEYQRILEREAARFTPGQAVHALADVTPASNLPSLPLAAALLGAYLVLGAVLAAATLEWRDPI